MQQTMKCFGAGIGNFSTLGMPGTGGQELTAVLYNDILILCVLKDNEL